MKVLVVSPIDPFPAKQANQQDIAGRLELFQELGHDVTLGVWRDDSDETSVSEAAEESVIDHIELSTGVESRLSKPYRTHRLFYRAASLYNEEAVSRLTARIREISPDLIWCEYGATIPVVRSAMRRLSEEKTIVCRAHNDEIRHQLEQRYVEHRSRDSLYDTVRTLKSGLTDFVGTVRCEMLMFDTADVVVPISPRDSRSLQKRHPTRDVRHLPFCTERTYPRHRVSTGQNLDVFFLGGTYDYSLNREAARFIVEEVAPMIAARELDVQIHLFGKHPPEMAKNRPDSSVVCHGFVDDLDAFLTGMDVSVVPSFFGTGLKVKCYESLRRGFPVVASPRALSDFDGRSGETYIEAETPEQFCDAFERLQDDRVRERIGRDAAEVMAESVGKATVQSVLQPILSQAADR